MAFQGSLRELPLPDIIQLVSVSGKTGMFALRREAYPEGEIFLREGRIVHARVGELEGEEAVYELAIWPEGDFVFASDGGSYVFLLGGMVAAVMCATLAPVRQPDDDGVRLGK